MANLGCLLCGDYTVPPGADGLYGEDDEITCTNCGAINIIGVDDDRAYVSRVRCRHGKDEDEACDLCEIEDGDGVGEVAT